jgi:hypothetical protein
MTTSLYNLPKKIANVTTIVHDKEPVYNSEYCLG